MLNLSFLFNFMTFMFMSHRKIIERRTTIMNFKNKFETIDNDELLDIIGGGWYHSFKTWISGCAKGIGEGAESALGIKR